MIVEPAYRYRAHVNRVIDGDTYVLDVDLGFRVQAAITVRVFGYDAPEMTGPDKLFGHVAKDAAEALLRKAAVIVVETYKDARSFERWVASVYVDGVQVSELLIAEGHVKRDRKD